jgi:hypothetical protein
MSLAAQRQDREQAAALAEIAMAERDTATSQPPEQATVRAEVVMVERDALPTRRRSRPSPGTP